MILDACVLIALLDDRDPHHDAAVAILDTMEPLRMHSVTLGEALVAVVRHGRLDAVRQEVLEPIGVEEVAAPGARLAVIRAESGLRMPDCCVLGAAMQTGDHRIATFDARLAGVARRRGFEVVPSPSDPFD